MSITSNKKFESNQLYQKPGPIVNECLLAKRDLENGSSAEQIASARRLRENLFEHYDFEALYPSVWSHLYSWYSSDTQIARYFKTDGLNDSELGTINSQVLKQALSQVHNGGSKLTNIELDLYP